MTSPSRERLLPLIRQAFINHGYDQLTMIGMAKACALTRRALYHHFSGKEDAFREMIRWRHEREIRLGLEAGYATLAQGGTILEAVVAIFDIRYGDARRDLNHSPHLQELNVAAFGKCHDIIVESAIVFQEKLAAFLDEAEDDGALRLRPGTTARQLAQFLSDGARGVNQTLPAVPANDLPKHYRAMSAAILYGCAEEIADFPEISGRA